MIITLKSILLSTFFLSTNHFDVVTPAASSTINPTPSLPTHLIRTEGTEASNHLTCMATEVDVLYDDPMYENQIAEKAKEICDLMPEKDHETPNIEHAPGTEDGNYHIGYIVTCFSITAVGCCIVCLCCDTDHNDSETVYQHQNIAQLDSLNIDFDPSFDLDDAINQKLIQAPSEESTMPVSPPSQEYLRYTTDSLKVNKKCQYKEFEMVFANPNKTVLTLYGYCRESTTSHVPIEIKNMLIPYLQEEEGRISFLSLRNIFLWDAELLMPYEAEYGEIVILENQYGVLQLIVEGLYHETKIKNLYPTPISDIIVKFAMDQEEIDRREKALEQRIRCRLKKARSVLKVS